jgi:hypothetical protein
MATIRFSDQTTLQIPLDNVKNNTRIMDWAKEGEVIIPDGSLHYQCNPQYIAMIFGLSSYPGEIRDEQLMELMMCADYWNATEMIPIIAKDIVRRLRECRALYFSPEEIAAICSDYGGASKVPMPEDEVRDNLRKRGCFCYPKEIREKLGFVYTKEN